MNFESSLSSETNSEIFRAFCEVSKYDMLRENASLAANIVFLFTASFIFYIIYKGRIFSPIVIFFSVVVLLRSLAALNYYYFPDINSALIFGIIQFVLTFTVILFVLRFYVSWHWATCILAMAGSVYFAMRFTAIWRDKVGFDDYSTGAGAMTHLPHLIIIFMLFLFLYLKYIYNNEQSYFIKTKYLAAVFLAYAASIAFSWANIYLCASIPTGTRFLGYIAQAVMCLILLRGVIKIRLTYSTRPTDRRLRAT